MGYIRDRQTWTDIELALVAAAGFQVVEDLKAAANCRQAEASSRAATNDVNMPLQGQQSALAAWSAATTAGGSMPQANTASDSKCSPVCSNEHLGGGGLGGGGLHAATDGVSCKEHGSTQQSTGSGCKKHSSTYSTCRIWQPNSTVNTGSKRSCATAKASLAHRYRQQLALVAAEDLEVGAGCRQPGVVLR